MTSKRTVLLLGILFIALAGIAAPVHGIEAPTEQSSHSAAEYPEQVTSTVTVEQTEDADVAEFTVDFTVPDTKRQFSFFVDSDVTVQDTTGFEKQSERTYTRYDMDTTNSPSMTYTADITDTANEHGDYGSGSNWVFGGSPYIEAVWVNSDNTVDRMKPLSEQHSETVSVDVTDGVAGANTAYFGEYTETEIGERKDITLIVPDSVEPPDTPEEIERVLNTYDDQTGFQGTDSIQLFISPVESGGGHAFFNGDMVVGHSESVTDVNNVYVHEYTHTQQTYTEADEVQWTSEAFAEYFGIKASYQQGISSADDAEQALEREGSGELNDPSSWEEEVNYRRGARVMANIDAEIIHETDGEKTLADVFYQLNSESDLSPDAEPVTEDKFISTVNEASGADLESEISDQTGTSKSVQLGDWAETVPQETASETVERDEPTDQETDPGVETETSTDDMTEEVTVGIQVTPEVKLGMTGLDSIGGCSLAGNLCTNINQVASSA